MSVYSLQEMNEEIAILLERMNSKIMRHRQQSRRELWETIDRPALKPLPAKRYQLADWKKVRLNIDYHFTYDHHHYSAPSSLAGEEIFVRATTSVIEVFYKHNRVASHSRSYHPHRMTTVPEHMPSSHRRYAVDLHRKSGEFPMSYEELDDAAATVYEGIRGGSGPSGANQRAAAARDRW